MSNFVFLNNNFYDFFLGIGESVYQSLIYDNRYKFIIEVLFNTVIIALFSVLIGIVIGTLVALIRNNYDKNGKMKLAIVLA